MKNICDAIPYHFERLGDLLTMWRRTMALEVYLVNAIRFSAETERYTRAADQERLAREAVSKLKRGRTEHE